MPFLLLCVGVVASVGVIAAAGGLDDSTRAFTLYSLSGLQLLLGTLGFLVLYRRRARPTADAGLFPRETGPEICVVLLTLCLMLLLVFGLTERGAPPVDAGWGGVIWRSFYYLVLIGFAEEVIFRGIPGEIFPQQPVNVLLVGSILFALYHLNGGLHTLPYYFAMGLVFGVLRYFSVSLVLLAAAHGLFDIVLSSAWPSGGFRFGATAFYVVAPFALLAVAGLAGWLLSSLNARRIRTTDSAKCGGTLTEWIGRCVGAFKSRRLPEAQDPAG